MVLALLAGVAGVAPAAAADGSRLPSPGAMPPWTGLIAGDLPELPAGDTWPMVAVEGTPDYVDNGVSNWVGGNLLIEGYSAEMEGVTVVGGNMTVNKTPEPEDGNWRDFNLGVVNAGSQIAPAAGSLMLAVGGNLDVLQGGTLRVGMAGGGQVAIGGGLTGSVETFGAGVVSPPDSAPYLGMYSTFGDQVDALSRDLAVRGVGGSTAVLDAATGVLTFTAGAPDTSSGSALYVFNVTAEQLSGAHEIHFVGLPDINGSPWKADQALAPIVINVTGPPVNGSTYVDLDFDGVWVEEATSDGQTQNRQISGDMVWGPELGLVSGALLWNFPDASAGQTVRITTTGNGVNFLGSIVIPDGSLYTDAVSLNGRLYVGGDYTMNDSFRRDPTDPDQYYAEVHNYPWFYSGITPLITEPQIQPLGTAQLSKAVAGVEATPTDPFTFTWTAAAPDGSPAAGYTSDGTALADSSTGVVAVTAGGAAVGIHTADGSPIWFPVGTRVSWEETGGPKPALATQEWTVSYAPAQTSVILADQQPTVDVTATNTVAARIPASFTIKKAISGPGATTVPTATTFNVDWTLNGVPQTPLTISADGTPVGPSPDVALWSGDTITFSESQPASVSGVVWAGEGYSVGGKALTNASVTLGGPADVTLTNYTGTPGTGVYVHKRLNGPAESVADGTTFPVMYYLNDVNPYSIGPAYQPTTVNLPMDGTPVQIPGAKVGDTVHLYEPWSSGWNGINPPSAPDHGTWAQPVIRVNGKPIAPDTSSPNWASGLHFVSFTVPDNGAMVEVEIENSLVPAAGFTLHKVVNGAARDAVMQDDSTTDFTVHYKVTSGPSAGTTGTIEVPKNGAKVDGPALYVGDKVAFTSEDLPQIAGVEWGDPALPGTLDFTDPNNQTVRDAVVTNTANETAPAVWDIAINKVVPDKDGDGDPDPIGGAAFKIWKDDGTGVANADWDAATTLTAKSGDPSTFEATDLSEGTYWLLETDAPDGYQLLAEPVPFTVAASGALSIPGGPNSHPLISVTGAGTVQVLNLPGVTLPFAGSGPAVWAMLAGGLLPLLSVALAWRLRSMRRITRIRG